MLDDIAILTGGRALFEDLGIKLESVELTDLGQLAAQAALVQPAESPEFLTGEEAGSGGLVVIVDRLSVDPDPRRRDHLVHVLRRLGQRRHPPALAPPLDRVVHPRVPHVEELDPVLGNDLLKQLVGLEGQGHVGGIGTDQDRVAFHDQIDRFGRFGVFLLAGELRQTALGPLFVDQIEIGQPLRGVDPRQGDHRGGAGKERGDA